MRICALHGRESSHEVEKRSPSDRAWRHAIGAWEVVTGIFGGGPKMRYAKCLFQKQRKGSQGSILQHELPAERSKEAGVGSVFWAGEHWRGLAKVGIRVPGRS